MVLFNWVVWFFSSHESWLIGNWILFLVLFTSHWFLIECRMRKSWEVSNSQTLRKQLFYDNKSTYAPVFPSSCFMTKSLRMLHGFYDNKFTYAPMFPSNSKHSQYYGMVMFVIGVISSLRYYKPLIWVSLKLPPQLQTYRGYFGNFVISFEIFW